MSSAQDDSKNWSTFTCSLRCHITHFGIIRSPSPFPLSNASFHRLTQRHHLHPSVKPPARKSFPREALKSRNSSVTIAIPGNLSPMFSCLEKFIVGCMGFWVGRTSNAMISIIASRDATISVTHEARHRFCGMEGKRFSEN